MKRAAIPVLFLLCAVFAAACSSNSGAATPTEAPRVAQTPVASPTAPPLPTATVARGAAITADNASKLSKVSSGRLDAPYSRFRWRADGQAVFITTQQAVFALQASRNDVTPVYVAAEPARVLDVAADGTAAVLTDPTTITLLDTGPDTTLATLKLDATVRTATFSPDSKVLAVSLQDRIAAQLWDVEKGTLVKELSGFQTAAPVYSVQFDSTGKNLIWLARATAQVQDLVTGQFGPRASSADFFAAVALSPIEKVLAGTAGTQLTLYDLANGDTLDVAELPAVAGDIAYSPDGKLLFAATGSGLIAYQMPLLQKLTTLDGTMRAVTISPEGDSLATISEDGVVTIYRPGS